MTLVFEEPFHLETWKRQLLLTSQLTKKSLALELGIFHQDTLKRIMEKGPSLVSSLGKKDKKRFWPGFMSSIAASFNVKRQKRITILD